jgi:hypothetical protein
MPVLIYYFKTLGLVHYRWMLGFRNPSIGLRLGGESDEFCPPVDVTRAQVRSPVKLERVRLASPVNQG